MSVKSKLREARKKAGLTQDDIAAAVGITRQAYNAIEQAKAVPSTEIALKLGRKLQASVEDLFYLDDEHGTFTQAEIIGDVPAPPGTRLQLFEVGPRLLARPLIGESAEISLLNLADATVSGASVSPKTIDARLINQAALKMPTLVLTGCDPSITFVSAMLRDRGVRMILIESTDIASLNALARGEAHIAGCHYRDKATGIYNSPLVKSIVPFPCTIVRFVKEQQGFIVRSGNPKSIQHVDDLVRPDVSIVNRHEGSGTRGLLHRLMNQANLQLGDIKGHNNCVSDDMSVAKIIRAGLVDCGMGVEAAARAIGLGFLPIDEEPYDLVIPNHFLNLPAVAQLLELLKSRELGRQVEALGGYDTTFMGKTY